MSRALYITTSWDDGHPLDLRLAELLKKYGLRGTFYVPRAAAGGTMNAAQIRALSEDFEIGAHTLDHRPITNATDSQAWWQIAGSKAWVEDVTGAECAMFCPPLGRYSRRHLKLARRAGFTGVRNVELSSLDYPRRTMGLLLMPTSIQAYPHKPSTFVRNALKRAAIANLWRCAAAFPSKTWSSFAAAVLAEAIEHGGVFHLWGHSWELQETAQWDRLEDVLRLISETAPSDRIFSNGEICREFFPSPAVSSIAEPSRAPRPDVPA